MLFAKNGRQMNLAAKTLTKHLQALGASLTHQQALELTAKLMGYSSVGAAEKALSGPKKGVPDSVRTWEELAHALGCLPEKERAQSIRVKPADASQAFEAALAFERGEGLTLVLPSAAANPVDYGEPVAVILEWVYPDESSDSCVALLDMNTGHLSDFHHEGEPVDVPLGDLQSSLVRTRVYLSEDDMDDLLDVYVDSEHARLYVRREDLVEAGWTEDALERNLERLAMQFELSTGESGLAALELARSTGLSSAMDELSSKHDIYLSVEPFVLYSPSEDGFYNVNFGWVGNADSATGFSSKMPGIFGLPADAHLVSYYQALALEKPDA